MYKPPVPRKKLYEVDGTVIVPADVWADNSERVTALATSGLTNAQIVDATGLDASVVRSLVRRYHLRKVRERVVREIKEEILIDKAPLLREIAEFALCPLREWLIELQDPEVREEKIRSVQDAKVLQELATNINNTLRLELGQSTSNEVHLQLKFEDVRNLLLETQKKDPVGIFGDGKEEPPKQG